MKIITLDQIKNIMDAKEVLAEIEKGFSYYSNDQTVVPPIGELVFQKPPGEVHIKYGYIKNDDYFVIKVASGFYENPSLNLPSSNGLMLLLSQKTGEISSIILDQGYLTDVRTAAAGAIVAKYLAPKRVTRIGIIGAGIQARLQLLYLKEVTPCREVLVFGRNLNKVQKFKKEMDELLHVSDPFSIATTNHSEEITGTCNLIVTTTPATHPLLLGSQIKKGTHITAVGADSPHKQELDPSIFQLADIVVADSIVQCIERGDIAHAIKQNLITQDKIIELGNITSGSRLGRTSEDQITVADLTGVAVQDIQIAKYVYNKIKFLTSKEM